MATPNKVARRVWAFLWPCEESPVFQQPWSSPLGLASVSALERGMNTKRVKVTMWSVALLWVMGVGTMESHYRPQWIRKQSLGEIKWLHRSTFNKRRGWSSMWAWMTPKPVPWLPALTCPWAVPAVGRISVLLLVFILTSQLACFLPPPLHLGFLKLII